MQNRESTITNGRPWRLRPRFGLRSFLIGSALLGIVLGWFAKELVRVRKQRAIVSELAGSGATFHYTHQFVGGIIDISAPPPAPRPLRWLFGDDLFTDVFYASWIKNRRSSDEQVSRLTELPELSAVSLSGPQVTNRSIVHLQKLQLLKEVALYDVGVLPDGIAQLANCPNLSNLVLYGSFVTDSHLKAVNVGARLRVLQIVRAPNVTDEGLLALKALVNLEHLDLFDVPKAGDSGVGVVAGLTHLKSLNLFTIAITDAALYDIGKLTKLERLGLNNLSITDDGVAALAKLKSLRSLQLSSTQISDAALTTVGEFTALEELYLSGTAIGDAGLSQFTRLSDLKKLELLNTGITGDGLLQLGNLPSLQYVTVSLSPNLSRKDAQQLKRMLPQCQIDCFRNVPAAAGGVAVLEATE